MPRVLLVDDDNALREILGNFLRRHAYEVDLAGSRTEAEVVMGEHVPDLILLDVMMTGGDGLSFLRALRKHHTLPVILVTARSAEHDILQGFTLGADDYVTKPFSFAQLEARIRARLQGTGSSDRDNSRLREAGDLVVDLEAHRVTKGENLVLLTPTEFKLLAALVENAGTVLSSEQLVSKVWGPEYAGADEYIRRYVWHLRRKLEDDPSQPMFIKNERSFGYYFESAAGRRVNPRDEAFEY